MRSNHVRLGFLWLSAMAIVSCGCASPTPAVDEADVIRDVERTRLRALVEADSAVMDELHAADFELINPDGRSTLAST